MRNYCQSHACLKPSSAGNCQHQEPLGRPGTINICWQPQEDCSHLAANILGKFEPEDRLLPLSAEELKNLGS